MVLHGIALYDLVSYVIYFAYFCVFRFVARALSRKTPIPSIHPSGSAHPSDSFGSSGSADPSESIHPSGSAHPSGSFGSSGSIHPFGLLFVICHLSVVIWYFLFFICLLVICCIVVYCIDWYIFWYLMVLHGIAFDLVSYIIYFAYFCVFRFVARAVSRKTPISLINKRSEEKDVIKNRFYFQMQILNMINLIYKYSSFIRFISLILFSVFVFMSVLYV